MSVPAPSNSLPISSYIGQENLPLNQKIKASDSSKIEIDGFLKILTAKITNQDPFNQNSDPIDVMADMAQMMMVQNSNEQVSLEKEILEELKALKLSNNIASLNAHETQSSIVHRLNSIESHLSSIHSMGHLLNKTAKSGQVQAETKTMETAASALKLLDRFIGS